MTSLEPEIWFFVRDGRRVGPFNRTGLLRELLVQEAPEVALVWRSGLPGWTKASLLDDLRKDLPPPVPGAPLAMPPNLEPPELPETSEGATAGVSEPAPEAPLSDADFTGEVGENPATKEEARRERRRKRRRHQRAAGLPGYAIPLLLLFVAVMIGLWFLLRRMNEVPPGRVILQGAHRPSPATPLTGSRLGATPA